LVKVSPQLACNWKTEAMTGMNKAGRAVPLERRRELCRRLLVRSQLPGTTRSGVLAQLRELYGMLEAKIAEEGHLTRAHVTSEADRVIAAVEPLQEIHGTLTGQEVPAGNPRQVAKACDVSIAALRARKAAALEFARTEKMKEKEAREKAKEEAKAAKEARAAVEPKKRARRAEAAEPKKRTRKSVVVEQKEDEAPTPAPDAAGSNDPVPVRRPTKDEVEELLKECTESFRNYTHSEKWTKKEKEEFMQRERGLREQLQAFARGLSPEEDFDLYQSCRESLQASMQKFGK
jgi:hypothetical protein